MSFRIAVAVDEDGDPVPVTIVVPSFSKSGNLPLVPSAEFDDDFPPSGTKVNGEFAAPELVLG